jgi:hypothetical protein
MRKIFSIIAVFTLVTVLFSGCEKKGDPPVLPPLETMKIDFSDFSSVSKSADITGFDNSVKGVSNGNYQFASSVARFWNILLTINLAIPVASFAGSFDQTPAYLDNKTWQWSYSVNAVGATYNARLTGQIRDNDVKWEMHISKDGAGAFAEFLWFEGTSALNGKSGQWILNNKNDASVSEKLLTIDWTRENEIVGSVKYTYVKNDQYNESYIEYGLKDAALNAFYNVHLYEPTVLHSFVDVFIEWSTTNHNGHVKAFYEFTDNNWHCWDSNGNDVLCN